MHAEYTEKQRVLAAQEELNALNAPFAPLAQLLGKVPSEEEAASNAVPTTEVMVEEAAPNAAPTPEVVADEATTSKPACTKAADNSQNTDFSVSPELSKFLKNKSALAFSLPNADELWKQMTRLRKELGIDLNFLVDNLQSVIEVLSAHENLETATASLTHAEHEHSVAMERYTSDCSMDNLHLFVSAAKTYQTSKDICNAAREDFAEKCNIFENAVAKAL